jgi:hypothetical protein
MSRHLVRTLFGILGTHFGRQYERDETGSIAGQRAFHLQSVVKRPQLQVFPDASVL